MRDELGGQIMKKFVVLRAKAYSYLKDNNDEDKKSKWHKKDSLKEDKRRKIKEFIKNSKLILKTQQRFRSEKHNVFTEEINKIALSSNDDKRIQSIDSIETYAHGMNKDLLNVTI